MLILQGVKVTGLEMFHTYMNFQEVYNLLKSADAYLFYEFGQEELMEYKLWPLRMMLFGKENSKTGTLHCVESPSMCLEFDIPVGTGQFIQIFREAEEGQLVAVNDMSAFIRYIFILSQYSYKVFHPQLDKANNADSPLWEELRKAIENVVVKITENGKRMFTYEAASEMYLYFMLHALAGRLPDQKENLSVLEADLNRMCPVTGAAKRENNVFYLCDDDSAEAWLPIAYYTGKEDRQEELSVIELKNTEKHEIRLKVKGTILSRRIPAERSVYAVRKGSHFVSFLPRFALNGEIVTYWSQGKLYNVWNESRELIQTGVEEPAAWVQSNEYGNFIIDKDGKLDDLAAWPDEMPELAVVSVDACGLDYGMLLSDGRCMSRIKKENWKNLIAVSIGLNNSAAINAERHVILEDGSIIGGFEAAAAVAYNEHYILLEPMGSIQTDSALHVKEKVFAVSVCERGYLLAMENKVCLYDYKNHLQQEWQIAGVTELKADRNLFAYYDSSYEEVNVVYF